MKCAKSIKRHIRSTSVPRSAWCPPGVYDAFCYTIDTENGMKGIRRTGGIAGVNEFVPLVPSLKT